MDHRIIRQGAGTSAFISAPSLHIPMHQEVPPGCFCCRVGRGRDARSQGSPIPHAPPGVSAQPSAPQHERITKFCVWLTNSSLIQPWGGGKAFLIKSIARPRPARGIPDRSPSHPGCHVPSQIPLWLPDAPAPPPDGIFGETREATSLPLSAKDQPGFQHQQVISYSQKDPNIGEELMSLPDLPEISQFACY